MQASEIQEGNNLISELTGNTKDYSDDWNNITEAYFILIDKFKEVFAGKVAWQYLFECYKTSIGRNDLSLAFRYLVDNIKYLNNHLLITTAKQNHPVKSIAA